MVIVKKVKALTHHTVTLRIANDDFKLLKKVGNGYFSKGFRALMDAVREDLIKQHSDKKR